MKRIFVKPSAPGLVVLDENGVQIPADGKEIWKSTYISRAIKAGELVVSEKKISTVKDSGRKKETGDA